MLFDQLRPDNFHSMPKTSLLLTCSASSTSGDALRDQGDGPNQASVAKGSQSVEMVIKSVINSARSALQHQCQLARSNSECMNFIDPNKQHLVHLRVMSHVGKKSRQCVLSTACELRCSYESRLFL